MWDRVNLKLRAKQVLKVSYGKAFVAALLLSLIAGGGSAVEHSYNQRSGDQWIDEVIHNEQLVSVLRFALPFLISATLAVFVLGLALRVLVLNVLEVGGSRYFLEAAQYRFSLGNLGFGFMGGGYWNVTGTMVYRSVLIFLWTLLLVIPGIVKSYAYQMVPYILADNPRIPYKRALQMSNEMTRGHKADMFVLDLSFLGWFLLGALACGVGVFFVNPYVHATQAELYLTLREIALQNGIAHPDEFRCL